MLLLVPPCGDEVGAVGGAVDRDFTLRAAADCADLFSLSGAEPLRAPLLADGANHGFALGQVSTRAMNFELEQDVQAHNAFHNPDFF